MTLLLPLAPPMLLGPLCHSVLSTGHVPWYRAERFGDAADSATCWVCVPLLVILESLTAPPPSPSSSEELFSSLFVLNTY
jgi:hypothetical protein